jgi:hypothetical protein
MTRKICVGAMMVWAPVHPSAGGEVLIEDQFQRGAPTEAVALDGVSPGVTRDGNDVWIAAADWSTDGSAVVNQGEKRSASCFFPFLPESGRIYELSATITATDDSPESQNWVGIGFSPAADPRIQVFAPALCRNGILLRPDNQARWVFDGEGGLLASNVRPGATLSVILDTTHENWTLAWKIDGQDAGAVRIFNENPVISYVAFGNYKSAGGRIENFTLRASEGDSASAPAVGGSP